MESGARKIAKNYPHSTGVQVFRFVARFGGAAVCVRIAIENVLNLFSPTNHAATLEASKQSPDLGAGITIVNGMQIWVWRVHLSTAATDR